MLVYETVLYEGKTDAERLPGSAPQGAQVLFVYECTSIPAYETRVYRSSSYTSIVLSSYTGILGDI